MLRNFPLLFWGFFGVAFDCYGQLRGIWNWGLQQLPDGRAPAQRAAVAAGAASERDGSRVSSLDSLRNFRKAHTFTYFLEMDDGRPGFDGEGLVGPTSDITAQKSAVQQRD